MGMAYTKMGENAFKHLVLNAGVLASAFNPATGELKEADLLGVTTGGVTFNTNPTYEDFAADIDQAPDNMKEYKRKTGEDPTLSGTFAEITADLAKMLTAAGDTSGTGVVKITPRSDLTAADFTDVWWIGDYSDINTGANAGFLAIHLINALNTTGFQINATKNAKGQFAFEWHAHYSIAAQDTVPYEIYIKEGTTESVTP